MLCSNQWRAGFSGATGLDFGVVIEVARALRLEVNQIFFEKLKVFETAVLNEMKPKQAEKQDGKRRN